MSRRNGQIHPVATDIVHHRAAAAPPAPMVSMNNYQTEAPFDVVLPDKNALRMIQNSVDKDPAILNACLK
jgi:hypothetical protein